MAKWRMDFRVLATDEDDVRSILRNVSKLDPRPISATDLGSHVTMVFIVDVKSQAEAHGQQGRLHDRLSKVMDDTFDEYGESPAIEFDAPREVEAGANDP